MKRHRQRHNSPIYHKKTTFDFLPFLFVCEDKNKVDSSIEQVATNGVPQGSHLGAFIILLYINDVNLSLECFKLSYADDFKFYNVIKCDNDTALLQKQLDADWCKNNKMILNAF